MSEEDFDLYDQSVVGDATLFGDDEPDTQPELVRTPVPIADWQVDLLRQALDARRLTSMGDRQKVIEEAAGRTVQSLRSLTHDEGMLILTRLGDERASRGPETSTWDDRDEDTWIDRL